MKRTLLLLSAATAFVATLSLSSCRKDPLKDMSDEESRIYITNHESQANFQSFTTFSIVDSVAVLSSNTNEKKALTDYDRNLIAAVKTAMQQRGYTLVDKAAKPDLGITLTRIDNSYNNISWNPGYWGGYPGFWDPGYWGYPSWGWGWPSYYTVYQVQDKQVAIDVFDLKNPKNNKLIAVWNSLWRGSGVWNSKNIDSMTKAVFDQSPYLTKNK